MNFMYMVFIGLLFTVMAVPSYSSEGHGDSQSSKKKSTKAREAKIPTRFNPSRAVKPKDGELRDVPKIIKGRLSNKKRESSESALDRSEPSEEVICYDEALALVPLPIDKRFPNLGANLPFKKRRDVASDVQYLLQGLEEVAGSLSPVTPVVQKSTLVKSSSAGSLKITVPRHIVRAALAQRDADIQDFSDLLSPVDLNIDLDVNEAFFQNEFSHSDSGKTASTRGIVIDLVSDESPVQKAYVYHRQDSEEFSIDSLSE